MHSERDYPYDPNARSELLQGLEKLRAIEDRGVAKWLFELYEKSVEYEYSGRSAADEAERERQRGLALREARMRESEAALRGDYGREARTLANELLLDRSIPGTPRRRTDARTLEVFSNELGRLRQGRDLRVQR
jgi:hypothetical protein